MMRAILPAAVASLAVVLLSSCGQGERHRPTAEREGSAPRSPSAISPATVATTSPKPVASASAVPSHGAAAQASAAPLDLAALSERTDPDRVVRYYLQALEARQWDAAARAWGPQSGVTAAVLKATYDRATPPRFESGTGRIEGAAGSLYYEVPVSVRFGPDAATERGTRVLRRANDVPGATPAQLRWHIERSLIGQGS